MYSIIISLIVGAVIGAITQRDLGTGWGKLYVPDEVLENLRPGRK